MIVVTGYGTVHSAVQAMKDGAYDYVTKPFSMEELRLLLERVAGHLRLKTENRVLAETIKSRQGFGNIVGRAPGDGETLPHHRESGTELASGADSGRKRHGQRVGGKVHSLWPASSATSRSFRSTVGRWCRR